MSRADRHREDPDGPLLTWREVVTTLLIAAAATAATWAIALMLAGT